jgi:peptidoglycan/LPS O-acetylase OafA/YrhL
MLDFKHEVSKLRKKVLILASSLLLVFYLMSFQLPNTIQFITDSLLSVLLIGICGAIVYYWRCPNCGRSFGPKLGPKSCSFCLAGEDDFNSQL